MSVAFVVHGVANRDEGAFAAQVAALERRVQAAGRDVELVPVFWGDLGARDDHLGLVVPGATDPPPGLGRDLLAGAATARDLLDPPRVVATAAATTAQPGAADGVGARGLTQASGPDVAELDAAVRAQWPRLVNLPAVTDPALLADVGRLLGRSVPAGPGPGEVGERGVGDWVGERLRDIDVLVGRVVGAAGGALNTFVRVHAAPAVAQFLGDVLVYQRLGDRVRARLRDAVAAWAARHPDLPGPGTPAAPATVVAHSLGGVVALDLAVGADPLTTRAVTFGSQWPLFQLIDPRLLAGPDSGTPPITLPPSVTGWTNVVEPLDPLAFVAGRAFRLADGTAPEDVRAEHLGSTGLWTHSSYWTAGELVDVLARVLPHQGGRHG